MKIVDPGDHLVERRGAEDDRERVGLAGHVEVADTVSELSLGAGERGLGEAQLVARPALSGRERVGLGCRIRQLRAGSGELRLERIEVEHGAIGPPRDGPGGTCRTARGRSAAHSREGHGGEGGHEKRCKTGPKGSEWPCHGAGPYHSLTEVSPALEPQREAELTRFRSLRPLQASETVARVPNL